MRVLLVTNGLGFGGAERVVEALADGLIAGGDEVLVVATTRGGPIGQAMQARGTEVRVLGIASPADVTIPLKLARLGRRFRPDVVHSHLAVADIATSVAAPMLGRVPIITTAHNNGTGLGGFKRGLWHLALNRFNRALSVSNDVQSALPVPSQVVRPTLVDLDAPQLSKADARQRLGLSPEDAVVLSIGRLHHVKGFDVLAQAAVGLDARVIVIGEGPERPRLQGGRLELAGALGDAATLIPAADVVCVPSRSESAGLVTLEAMAASRPVVGTNTGGTAEIVEPDKTGLLVPSNDPEALRAGLQSLLSDPARAATLGQNGRQRIAERGLFRQAMIDSTRAVYEEVMTTTH